MKLFSLWIWIYLAFASFARVGFAESLQSIIAPHFGAIYVNETRQSSFNTEAQTKGFRYTFRTDFMSLPNHVSINVTGTLGANYWDVGGQFRLFDYATLRELGSSGVIYGLGAGFAYSNGYDKKLVSTSSPFVDFLITAYARFQFDTQNEWGIFFETAYEGIVLRSFTKQEIFDRTGTHRFLFAVGIPFEFSDRTYSGLEGQ